MQLIRGQNFTDERSLFGLKEAEISHCTFDVGESPLKHSSHTKLENSIFKWKYPLWYSLNSQLKDCILLESARAGIWYSSEISMQNCLIHAPKTFRRSREINICNTTFTNASETLWNCNKIRLENVSVVGDYFAMNCCDMEISNFNLSGNYAFDGAKNLVLKNCKLLCKDAFWNAENIVVYNSFICGEYLGWNCKNITLINCSIESLQGMCYIQNLVLKNCKTINTTLAFEYSSVNADIKGEISSILNPKSGKISATKIGEIIIDENLVNKDKISIIQEQK